MTYRNPLCHRYGLRHSTDKPTGTRAYVTLDGTKTVWSERSTVKGRVWSAYGSDEGIWSCIRRDFDTLREATEYATGRTIPKTTRRG